MFVKIKQINDLQAQLDAKLDDSQLSTVTTLGVSDSLLSSQNAVKTYVDNKIMSVPSVMNYIGTFDAAVLTDFTSITPASTGDLYKIISDGTVEGLELFIGDMIIVKYDTTSVIAADLVLIDNTETLTLIRDGVIITDDTLATATDSNIPSSQTVVDYVTSIVGGTKESCFLERYEEFTGIVSAIGNPANYYTLFNISTNFACEVFINGVELDSTEFSLNINPKQVTITLGYAIDAVDTIAIRYKTPTYLVKSGTVNNFATGTSTLVLEYTGVAATTASLQIDGTLVPVANNGGVFEVDSTPLATIGASTVVTINTNDYTIIFAGFIS